MDITIRRALQSDAAALSVFARRLFDETFSPDNPSEIMVPYMNEAFAAERLVLEIQEPQSVFWLAFVNGTLGGYARVRRNPEVDHELGTDNLELQRLYVDSRWHGCGIAGKLMEEVVVYAADRRWLWLGVWEKNLRAIRFYEKWDFQVFGTHGFMLGDELQTDLVMRRRMRG